MSNKFYLENIDWKDYLIKINLTMKMEKISFDKMSGAGNDFIVFNMNTFPQLNLDKNLVKKICDRHFGLGADGVITISNSEKYDFVMKYFNADGTTGSLCGNGARCAIMFAKKNELLKNNYTKFLSNDLEYSGEIISEREIRFNLSNPKKIKLNFKVKAGNQLITASFVDTGSPHIVIYLDQILVDSKNPKVFYTKIGDVPVVELGREIRNLPEFSPNGVNVNFLQAENNYLIIRTYERGVEDETLACGTGSVASAIISNLIKNFSAPVTLITRGNDKLFVDFEVENNRFSKVSLTGPAEFIFAGEIQKSFFE